MTPDKFVDERRQRWLGHADARQVSDLPEKLLLKLAVYDRQGLRP